MENNRHLQFVLKHYREGAFNTGNAIEKFNKAAGGRPKRGFIRYLIGAAAAAAVVLFIFIFNPKPQPVHLMTAEVPQTFFLPDSTSVTLAPYSSLEYDARAFMRKSRSVRMEGKSFFDVRHNEENPFEISTAGAYIKVLGTSFQINATEGTEVYVRSGRVLFAESSDAEGVILTKGMEAVLKSPGDVPELIEMTTPNPAAWATGRFEYESVPLEDVLYELSEFYGVSLTASDYDCRLSAKFDTSDSIDDIIGMISVATGIQINY